MPVKFPISFDAQTRADTLQLIELALREDVGSSDLATAVDGTTQSLFPNSTTVHASFVARQPGIICGLQVCQLAIEKFAPNLHLVIETTDSNPIETGQTLARISGNVQEVLLLERTCLNFLCHLSAISTLTRAYVEQIAGTRAEIFDTRKTTPAWRRVEKYAVQCGGGANHRMGLFDAIMIKDNHLAMHHQIVQGDQLSIPAAVKLTRQWIETNAGSLPNGDQTILQIEVDTLEQLQIALPSKPDIILLDNMSTEQLEKAVGIRDQIQPAVILEASGGVQLETVKSIAQTGVERISVGALTHSAGNFDIGLDWKTVE